MPVTLLTADTKTEPASPSAGRCSAQPYRAWCNRGCSIPSNRFVVGFIPLSSVLCVIVVIVIAIHVFIGRLISGRTRKWNSDNPVTGSWFRNRSDLAYRNAWISPDASCHLPAYCSPASGPWRWHQISHVGPQTHRDGSISSENWPP